MDLSIFGKDLLLDGGWADTPFASLHRGDPGGTGANEISGGSPVYARNQVTFAAASMGTRITTAFVSFDVPGSVTAITNVGFWDASSGGNYLGSHTISSSFITAQGIYTLTQSTIDVN